MPRKRTRLIYELSPSEQESKFRTVVIAESVKTASLNLPIVYRNELCVTPGLFIHQYPDGKKLLIEQDPFSFAQRTIRVLA